jgi:glycosyltransferase involved in cell wall biosynthesis
LGKSLKIAWATPFAKSSAIGRVSADVTAALAARGHEVRIILTEFEGDGHARRPEEERHVTKLPCVHISDVRLHELSEEVDVVVAQIGDHFLNHAGIFDLFTARDIGVKLPLLGIFHDFYLYNLYKGWLHFHSTGNALSAHRRAIESTYGPDACDLEAGGASIEELAQLTPMTEWIAARCDGALAHAHFYEPRLVNSCPGPTAVASLPVTTRGVPPLRRRELGHRLTALTVGIANPNKGAEQVINAIASSDFLREQLDYRLTGPIEADRRAKLEGLAAQLGYAGLLIDGAVDDATLARRLEESDLVICLRKPVLEGASGSAVEGLLAGRPLVVADAGFYGELPSTVVFKVPADLDRDVLAATLAQLCTDEDLRLKVGARARAFAKRRFNLGNYLGTLEPLLGDVITAMPTLQMSRAVGRRLAGLGLDPNDPSVDRIAARLGAAFADGALHQ